MMTSNKRYSFILLSIPLLLLIPLVAMQYTEEVNWSRGDFLVMGMLLFIVGSASELVLRKVTSRKNRLLLVLVILFLFFLIWAELAVGVFD